MNEEVNRLKELVKRIIAQIVIPKKVIPSIKESHPYVKDKWLGEASEFVANRVGKSIDSMKVFQADLFLARIPNVEFLEVMVLLYYFVISIERIPETKSYVRHDNDLLEVKKILRAFGIETGEDLEKYRDLWRRIWESTANASEADESFEKMKNLLNEQV